MGYFMGILKRFRKKVEQQTIKTEPTELEKLCSDTPEIYEALKDSMFLDPSIINLTPKDVVERAKEFEKAGDTLRAAVWYKIAGGLAIYEGVVPQVKKFFQKYAELTGKTPKILEKTDEAVKKAQEYYKIYGKRNG